MAWGFLAGAFFFLGCLLITQTSCAPSARVRNAPQASMPTVAKLVTVKNGEVSGHCTAWKVGAARAITAGHCCDPGDTFVFTEGLGLAGSPIRVLIDDDKHDICVLEAYMRGPSLQLASLDPAIGEYVWTAGYPVRPLVISGGFWSGRVDIEVDDQMMSLGVSSVVVAGGASGSPLMNARGQAVGMVVAGYTRSGDNIAFSTTVEWLRLNLHKSLTR